MIIASAIVMAVAAATRFDFGSGRALPPPPNVVGGMAGRLSCSSVIVAASTSTIPACSGHWPTRHRQDRCHARSPDGSSCSVGMGSVGAAEELRFGCVREGCGCGFDDVRHTTSTDAAASMYEVNGCRSGGCRCCCVAAGC